MPENKKQDDRTIETIRHFISSDFGATAIEYALIAGLLSIAVIGSAFLLGGGITDMWNYVRDEVVAATTF
jgi:pilus assembly protein Flp/PilA